MKTIALDFETAKVAGTISAGHWNTESERDAGKMILIGIHTGLRKCDLLALTPDNFKERNGDFYIVGTAQKTGKPFEFPVPRFVYDSVMEDVTLPDTIYHKQRSHIFLNRWMNTLFAKEVKRVREQYGKSCTIGPHSLRKTFGIHVYETRGITVARQALQHKNLATTTRYLEIEERKLMDDLKAVWST